jgi:hypothetical protein
MLEDINHGQIAGKRNAVSKLDLALREGWAGIPQLLGNYAGLTIEKGKSRVGASKPRNKRKERQPKFSRPHHCPRFSCLLFHAPLSSGKLSRKG